METREVAQKCLACVSSDVRRPGGRGVTVGFRGKWVLPPSLPIPLSSSQLRNFSALPRIITVALGPPKSSTLHTGCSPWRPHALPVRPSAVPSLHAIPSMTSFPVWGMTRDGSSSLAGLGTAYSSTD